MSQTFPPTPSSSSYQSIFDCALESYGKKTQTNLLSHPLLAKLETSHSPDAILTALREQIPGFDQSRSRDEKLTRWLDSTVNVISSFSATIGGGISLAYPPAGVIFTGIGVLLSAATAVSSTRDTLIDVFERIENFFRRLEVYIDVPPTVGMIDIIVKIMCEVLSVLAIATKEIKQGKAKAFLNRLIGRTDIEDALRRLDKLTQDEVRMAAAQGLKATHRVNDRMKGIDVKIDSIIDGGRQISEEEQRNQLRQNLAKWLSPADPSINYNTATNAHHGNTALWFIQSDTFNNWKQSSSLLWIYGKPGSGKTVLTSAIIQHISCICGAGSGHIAFFFFDFKDTGKQDPRALLSSLIVQLNNQSNSQSFYDILFAFHSAHQGGTQQPSIGALTNCLENMLRVVGDAPIYLIVDALDECPNTAGIPSSRDQVLDLVEKLVKLNIPNLRLCVTSRPEIDIRASLEPLTSRTNRMSLHDEGGQKNDIIDFVSSVVHSDKKMRRWRDEDKKLVIETLSERADGMFRWVFCQLEILRHSLPPSVRGILTELPETLDETYKRILQEIPKSNRVYAHRLLQCLTVAVRPLRVEELAEVLAIRFTEAQGVPTLNENLRWEDQEQAVLSACSSLIVIVGDGFFRVVQFAHFSVKEFLTSDRLSASRLDACRYHHIRLEHAHTIMAQACLCVLLRIDRQSRKNLPLADYAAKHFQNHAEFGNVLSYVQDGIDDLLNTDKPHFVAWLWARRIIGRDESSMANPLYYVAMFGFCGLVQHLISRHPEDVLAQGVLGTPLHAALDQGHIDVSELLLRHCADVDVRNISGRTPLHLAVFGGRLEITRMLIGRGANVNARDNNGQTPLHRSVDNLEGRWNDRYFDILLALLDHGAATDALDNDHETALHIASSCGCSRAVQLLLEHGANPHVWNSHGRTPLHVVHNDVKVTELLLEHGADVNALDVHRSTPLHVASYDGAVGGIQALLRHGASVNLRNDQGQTPLHYTIESGYVHAARVLLEHGADTESQDVGGWTPLHFLSYQGGVEATELLLEYGANVHAQDNKGKTPLQAASAKGYHEIVRLLSKYAQSE